MRYIQSEGEEDERVRRGEHKLLLTTEEAAALRGWMPKLPLQPVEGRANEFAIEEGVLAVLVLPTAGLAAPARQLEAGGRWLEAAAWTRTTAAFLRLRGTAGQGTPGAAVAAALAARRSASADVKAALELQPSDFGKEREEQHGEHGNREETGEGERNRRKTERPRPHKSHRSSDCNITVTGAKPKKLTYTHTYSTPNFKQGGGRQKPSKAQRPHPHATRRPRTLQ